MNQLSATSVIGAVVDRSTFSRWDRAITLPSSTRADIASDYLDELATARSKSGEDESVVTGEALLAGRRIAVVASEFKFLGGSIGLAAADRVVKAVERATRERLPLLALPASGGTRMQEGTLAFAQMIKISTAIAVHKAAKLPYLVYLRHPCTGGVLASWGSLGHVTACEPGALVGFLGPRVQDVLGGSHLPDGVQRAENLLAHGLVDAVLDPETFRDFAIGALSVLVSAGASTPDVQDVEDLPVADSSAWESIGRSRRQDRPGVRELLRSASNTVTFLSGTESGIRRTSLVVALARFGSAGCVLIGHDRHFAGAEPLSPAALHEAQGAMQLAAELQLPLVTVIDTPGSALSQEAEESGLAREIARTLATLSMLPTPTLCLLLGQGGGGGALAIMPADRVICAQHGWLAPLPPEGAAVIRYRDPSRATDMARDQGVRSLDLKRNGIVDRILHEYPDAADDPERFLSHAGRVLESELLRLIGRPVGELLSERSVRYRGLGQGSSGPGFSSGWTVQLTG